MDPVYARIAGQGNYACSRNGLNAGQGTQLVEGSIDHLIAGQAARIGSRIVRDPLAA
jgi:hypothetical protein